MQVVKRDGKVVDFDQSKIRIAIEKANKEVKPKERATKEEINQIIEYVEDIDTTNLANSLFYSNILFYLLFCCLFFCGI